jgi:hypothetical protein
MTSRRSFPEAISSPALTNQAATNSDHRPGKVRSATVSAAATAHTPTARHPESAIRSGLNDGELSIADHICTDP